jgi:DNA invertase Pin-like site-specific DNA recombinase
VRGYYRLPKKFPSNRVDGTLAEIVRAKFAEGWPKARIAREFRLHRHTVARICSQSEVAKSCPLTGTQSVVCILEPSSRKGTT